MMDYKKNFGFGCMRLPMTDNKIDIEQVSKMVDLCIEKGFNYFDTAHGYHEGQSEPTLKTCLTDRYPREAYFLTDKLTGAFFKTEADIRPLFESQLEACGVKYFDYYLMHAQTAKLFKHFKACRAYETAFELKKEGKIRHVGLSFHDHAALLDQILTEYPEIEVVQIQLNYLDMDDPAIQSRACLEVCRKHQKPVIVMEPVKGGNLADLPEDAADVFKALDHGRSAASYALRFAAGTEGVDLVISGMSNLKQMKDNLATMTDFEPLNDTELKAVSEVCEIMRSKNTIACTACRYCVADCPQKILIPDLFACYNEKELFQGWHPAYYYHNVHTIYNGKASDCIECGQCESACPQHLPIRDLLKTVAAAFEESDENL